MAAHADPLSDDVPLAGRITRLVGRQSDDVRARVAEIERRLAAEVLSPADRCLLRAERDSLRFLLDDRREHERPHAR